MMQTVLILAGGASSRMKASKPSTNLSQAELTAANNTNKGLIILDGDTRPVLDYLIINCAKAGFKQVILITGNNQEVFLNYYGNNSWNRANLGIQVNFAKQHIPTGRTKPHGTADAVFQALQQYPNIREESFAVCNCDNLYSVQAFKLLQQTPANNAFIAYNRDGLDFLSQKIARFALCKLDLNNNLEYIQEKPETSALDSFRDNLGKLRVSMNIFKFNGNDFYDYLMDCPEHPIRKEKELPTAILNMVSNRKTTMVGIPLNEHVPDLTTKEDIVVFKNYLRS